MAWDLQLTPRITAPQDVDPIFWTNWSTIKGVGHYPLFITIYNSGTLQLTPRITAPQTVDPTLRTNWNNSGGSTANHKLLTLHCGLFGVHRRDNVEKTL